MNDRSVIRVLGAEVLARHGVSEQEREQAGRYGFDLELETDIRPAAASDDLNHTADYQLAYTTACEVLAGTARHLLETLAAGIADELLTRFPGVTAVTVRLRKLTVPFEGVLRAVEVELRRERIPVPEDRDLGGCVALSLGANLGDPLEMMPRALEAIGNIPGVDLVRASRLYATAPVGKTDQPGFLNCAALIRSGLEPDELMRELKGLERSLGRQSRPRWHPREIDIDIVLFGGRIIRSDQLTIPHPQMHLRRFVLEPLAGIAPAMRHPVLNQDMRTLLHLCRDDSPVRAIDSPPVPDHQTEPDIKRM